MEILEIKQRLRKDPLRLNVKSLKWIESIVNS